MSICLEQGANVLKMVWLMQLPSDDPSVSCFIKIQKRFIFMVPACPGCHGTEAIKWVFVSALYLCLSFRWAGGIGCFWLFICL